MKAVIILVILAVACSARRINNVGQDVNVYHASLHLGNRQNDAQACQAIVTKSQNVSNVQLVQGQSSQWILHFDAATTQSNPTIVTTTGCNVNNWIFAGNVSQPYTLPSMVFVYKDGMACQKDWAGIKQLGSTSSVFVNQQCTTYSVWSAAVAFDNDKPSFSFFANSDVPYKPDFLTFISLKH